MVPNAQPGPERSGPAAWASPVPRPGSGLRGACAGTRKTAGRPGFQTGTGGASVRGGQDRRERPGHRRHAAEERDDHPAASRAGRVPVKGEPGRTRPDAQRDGGHVAGRRVDRPRGRALGHSTRNHSRGGERAVADGGRSLAGSAGRAVFRRVRIPARRRVAASHDGDRTAPDAGGPGANPAGATGNPRRTAAVDCPGCAF